MSSPFRSSNGLWLLIVASLVALTGTPPAARLATFYVDINHPSCSDTGTGSSAQPYCSVERATNTANPGDIFLVQPGLYPQGPSFTRHGTVSQPITYQCQGYCTFTTDFDDTGFTLTATANVYSKTIVAGSLGGLAQTKFTPIVVDDPNNPSNFTMVSADGPMRLTNAPDDAVLAAHDGMYRVVGDVLYVHPYGNVAPSVANTDFINAGPSNQAQLAMTADYQILDGFTLIWSTGIWPGNNNRYLNLTFRTGGFALGGNNNYVENLIISHVIGRTASGKWLWYDSGSGSAGYAHGSNATLKNIRIFHNWNSSFNSEQATNVVVDGARVYGAPNHCGVVADTNGILRNAVIYGCQDHNWIHDPQNLLIEHMVKIGPVSISAVDRAAGPITIRNSIIGGTVNFVDGLGTATSLPYDGCAWEPGSLMENNIITVGATIERCDTQIAWPVLEYIQKCGTGEFTGCMTIRNNVMITAEQWPTVINGGIWVESMGDTWDPYLLAGSPAINIGVKSGTTIDILGVTRPYPVGGAYDAGAYEYTGTTPTRPATDVVVAAQAKVTTTITAPTSGTAFNAGASTTLTTLAGTAASGRTVTACTWTNSLGGAGAATLTAPNWSVASIPLTIGSNVVTVTCVNDGGTAGSDMLTVTRASELLAAGWQWWVRRAAGQ